MRSNTKNILNCPSMNKTTITAVKIYAHVGFIYTVDKLETLSGTSETLVFVLDKPVRIELIVYSHL